MQNLTIINGNNPVLLTAPHTFRHLQPSLKAQWKQGEPWTDFIAQSVATKTNSFCIYPNKALEYDPNYHKVERNPFKKKIKDLNKQYKFKAVIDIHGLSDKHQYDFGIFYMSRFGRSKKLALSLAQSVTKTRLRDSIIQLLNFNDSNLQETIAEFTTKSLRIPSLQLEIARYIREDNDLRDILIATIVEFINYQFGVKH